MPKRYSEAERIEAFWSHVDKSHGENSCWNWQAGVNPDGYGMMGWGKNAVGTHRIAWMLTNGEIPSDLRVLHSCDNRKCCNPHHLFLGTQIINIADMVFKDRHIKGVSSPQHKLTELEVKEIRKRYKAGGITHRQLASEYKVNASTITNCITHVNWKHILEEES